jgi:DNA-binding response OmpR family regulator
LRAAGFAVTTSTLRDAPYVSRAERFDFATVPGYGGLDLVPVIRKLTPKTVVLVLSGDERYEALALAAGADGFLLKGSPNFQEELLALLDRLRFTRGDAPKSL